MTTVIRKALISACLPLLIFSLVKEGQAQNTVSGSVLDATTGKGIELLQVSPTNKGSGRSAPGGDTDGEGRFTLSLPEGGWTTLSFYKEDAEARQLYFDAVDVEIVMNNVAPQSINPRKLGRTGVASIDTRERTDSVFYLVAIRYPEMIRNDNDPCASPTGKLFATLAESGTAINNVNNPNRKPTVSVTLSIANPKTGALKVMNPVPLELNKRSDLQVEFPGPGPYILTIQASGFKSERFFVIFPRDGTCLSVYSSDSRPVKYTRENGFLFYLNRLTRAYEEQDSGDTHDPREVARRYVFLPRIMEALPVPGVRSFDYFALLTPGVAPPPETFNINGPGVSPGVGTAGQFSVNGLRSRENNFTIDGSDNNDEDIGVRRQGFLSLAPLTIESLQEMQVYTALADARFGRNLGGQINALSKTGATSFHGSGYLFYTSKRFRARDFFNGSNGAGATTLRRASDNASVLLDGIPLIVSNPASEKNAFRRTQKGFTFGGPVWRSTDKPTVLNISNIFFFTAMEQKVISEERQSHFIVPTVEQRGVFQTGATGLLFEPGPGPGTLPLFPASIPGSAVFSLFPFPNNPNGPFGENTYTQVLPADGKAILVTGKLDMQFGSFRSLPKRSFWSFFRQGDILTGRYNMTHDKNTIPVTGGALFSSVRPRVQTQNIAYFLNRSLRKSVSDSIRFSFGRTKLEFKERRNASLAESSLFPDTPFLLNAPLLLNVTAPGGQPAYISAASPAGSALITSLGYPSFVKQTEQITGPLGQVSIPGFSPLGVDVYHFPQSRANNTFQIADTVTWIRKDHIYFFGADIRKVQINSTLDRNFRPYAVFNGLRSSAASPTLSVTAPDGGPLPTRVFSGATLAAAGVPTGFFQNLSVEPNSTIGIRSTQTNIFFQDQWQFSPHVRITLGLRYEFNTVPDTVTGRLEKAFNADELKKQATEAANECNNTDPNRCDDLVAALASAFPEDFKVTFGSDRNDFDVRFGTAWDLSNDGRRILRLGFGTYSGQSLAIVMSQSRAAFSDFLQLNVANFSPRSGSQTFLLNLSNPLVRALDPSLAIIRPGTLNALPPINPISLLTNRLVGLSNLDLTPTITGLDLVLPQSRLPTPYSMQYGATLELRLHNDYFLETSYVGTNGRRLLRLATPALGVDRSQLDEVGSTVSVQQLAPGSSFPFFTGRLIAPQPTVISQSFVIAPIFFESDSGSSYNSLQLELRRRYSTGFQFNTAFTYSHATDDASDFFDTAGAFALPQSSVKRSERGSSNYDLRFRSVTQFLFDTSAKTRGKFLGNWQVAGVLTAQSGQPYTVNSAFDINRDGNLTDRLNTTTGLLIGSSGDKEVQLRIAPGVSTFDLLASDGQDGTIGRNTFRAPGIFTLDLALSRIFMTRDNQNLRLRAEIFNVLNRTHFGVPVRILESPAFGRSQSTIVPPRTIQVALKYSF